MAILWLVAVVVLLAGLVAILFWRLNQLDNSLLMTLTALHALTLRIEDLENPAGADTPETRQKYSKVLAEMQRQVKELD